MRSLAFCLALTFLYVTSPAQTVFVVQPGNGTLNDAITAHQGNVIYELQAGGWYGLTSTIENSGFPLTIIGQVPTSPDSMPAMIQIGSDQTGVPLPNMFNLYDNLTLKNLFIVDANENNVQAASSLIQLQSPVKVVIDSVVFDPLGTDNGLVNAGTNERPSVFMTNSMVLRSGQEVDPNDGVLFQSSITGSQTAQWDTLYIENNTFVCTGTWFIANLTTDIFGQDNFVFINHNTFAIHKSQLYISYYPSQFYFTNNLLWDFNTQPYNIGWNIYYPDGSAVPEHSQSRLALVNNDTLTGETLPSSRKCYVAFNDDWTDPNILSVPAWGLTHTLNNDGTTALGLAYLMPLVYPKDSSGVNRECGMFNSTGFPHFIYKATLNIDPKWTLTKLYDLSDSLAAWTLPSAEIHCWGFDPTNVTPVAQWPKFWWNADTNGLGNPTAWPRFDGTYSDQLALTASSESLPLGDLNWYPDAKALWQANKATADAHVLAEDTTQITLTGVEQTPSTIPATYSLAQNFPNPFNPTTEIRYSVPKNGFITLKVYNVLGQEVQTLFSGARLAGNYVATFDGTSLASGVYFYRLSGPNVSITNKMLLLK